MPMTRSVSVALLGLAALACTAEPEPAGPTVEEDLAAIAIVRAELLEAMASDDVTGIMAGLAPDHLTMPPDGPAPPNNGALTEWHEARIALYSVEPEFTTEDVRVFGNVAIERWSGILRMIPKETGEAMEDSTKGIWIWERQEDGVWKLLWSIWNSNLPAVET